MYDTIFVTVHLSYFEIMNLDLYEISEVFLRWERQSPFLTVLVIEPIIFISAIHFLLYGFKIQEKWKPQWRMLFIYQSGFSLLSTFSGILLGIDGMVMGAVVAKGQGVATAFLFAFAPLGVAFLVSCIIFRKRGYPSLCAYLARI